MIPPTMTPEKLQEMATPTAETFARLYNLSDSARADLCAAIGSYGEMLLARLAAPPPPAPQDWKGWAGSIQQMCDGCKTATHCAHFKRCLAECVPADLTPSPVLDHEALVTLAEQAEGIYKGFELESLNGVVCSIPDEGLDAEPHRMWCARCQRRYRSLKALAAALRAAPRAPAAPQPQWKCLDCEATFVEHPMGHNHSFHDGQLSAGVRTGRIVPISPPSTSGAPR